jgi:hypothetical protein
MIIHIPTSALPHLRPALRLADPAQPVISLQGRRTPGAATRGRPAAPDPSAASARLGRPGGDGRADPAPAGKAASAGWSHPAPSCGGTIAWSPGRHGQAAAEMTSLAISVRELSTPCHLAHGLLDYAQYLTRTRDAEGAAAAIKEARAIAGRLRCQPLLDRAADIAPANPRCRIRSRRYLIWKSPPARPGSLRPQRPDYAGPDTPRMILMDRGFGRELLAHWDTERRFALVLRSRSVTALRPVVPRPGCPPGDMAARRNRCQWVCPTWRHLRHTRRQYTWRAGPGCPEPGRTASWFSDQRAMRLPGRRAAAPRRPALR